MNTQIFVFLMAALVGLGSLIAQFSKKRMAKRPILVETRRIIYRRSSH